MFQVILLNVALMEEAYLPKFIYLVYLFNNDKYKIFWLHTRSGSSSVDVSAKCDDLKIPSTRRSNLIEGN